MLRDGDLRGLPANGLAVVILITELGHYLWRMPGASRRGAAALILAVACDFGLLPRQYVLSKSNRVHLGRPGPKVDGGYHPAGWICDRCTAGDVILAPKGVAVRVPLRRGHPMPVISQQTWDATLAPHLGTEELSTRGPLRACVSGDVNAFSVDEFAGALKRYHLAGVCLLSPIKHAPELHEVLGASG